MSNYNENKMKSQIRSVLYEAGVRDEFALELATSKLFELSIKHATFHLDEFIKGIEIEAT